MSTPPARCCAPATSGRCSNAPAPYGQSRYIGAVEIAACNHPKHQAALRSLPDFQRRAGVCGADDCGKAAESGLCPEHRQLYRRHGIDIRALLAQEAPMTEPAPMPPAESQETADGGATFADILDALDVHTAPEPARTGRTNLCGGTGEQIDPLAYDGWSDKPCPGCDGCRDAEPPPVDVLTEEEFVRAFEARMQQVGEQEESDGEPSEGDIQDAYSGRWGQYTVGVDPATGKEHTATYVVELVRPSDHQTTDGLLSAILGPRQDTPTLADVQAELARERERADRAELDAVQERARADEAMEELATIAAMLDPEDAPAYDSDDQPIPLPTRVQVALMPHSESVLVRGLRAERDSFWGIINDTEWIAHVCGSYGATASLADRVLRLLPVERQRAILELQRAEAYIDVTRLQARFLNPPPPGRLEEYAAKVAEIEAKIAALDAGENEA